MRLDGRTLGWLVAVTLMACGPRSSSTSPSAPVVRKLAVLPAESAAFPKAAKAATEQLARARVKGSEPPEISKVTLEVVQLSIECVEPTPTCYQAVGRSLGANQLLFAQIDAGAHAPKVQVTISLFDVDGAAWVRRVTKPFPTEDDAAYGVHDVVEEATRP